MIRQRGPVLEIKDEAALGDQVLDVVRGEVFEFFFVDVVEVREDRPSAGDFAASGD